MAFPQVVALLMTKLPEVWGWPATSPRHITAAGVRVVEVDRSDRQDHRRQGKSDSLERRQRCPRRPVRPGPRRVQGPRWRGRGDPRTDGLPAPTPNAERPKENPRRKSSAA